MRQENLITLCKAWDLTASDLSLRLGSRYSFWRDLLKGQKSFGEKIARRIEEGLSLPRGWLDAASPSLPEKQPPEVPKGARVPDDPDYSISGRGGNIVGLPVTGELAGAEILNFTSPEGYLVGAGADQGARALRISGGGGPLRLGWYAVVEQQLHYMPGEFYIVDLRTDGPKLVEFLHERDDGALVFEDAESGDRLHLREHADILGLPIMIVAVVSPSRWVPDLDSAKVRSHGDDFGLPHKR